MKKPFRTDYSDVTSITLDGSFYCLDGLDYFCEKRRASNNCGYFGYRYDPETDHKYYALLDLPYKFEFGSVVTKDDREIIITNEANNTKYIFNLDNLIEIAKYQDKLVK
jgi:hypothetical protein